MARLSLLAGWLILPVAAQGAEPAPIATLVDRLAEPESRVGARRELLAIGGRALPELLAGLGPAAESDAVDAHALACLDVLTALGEEAASVAPQLLVWIGTVHERDAGLALLKAVGRIAPYAEDRAALEEKLVSAALDDRPDHRRFDYLVAALFAVSRISIDPQAPLPVLLDIVAKDECGATEPGQETTYPPTLTPLVPPAATGAGDVLFVVLARYPRKLAGRCRLDRM